MDRRRSPRGVRVESKSDPRIGRAERRPAPVIPRCARTRGAPPGGVDGRPARSPSRNGLRTASRRRRRALRVPRRAEALRLAGWLRPPGRSRSSRLAHGPRGGDRVLRGSADRPRPLHAAHRVPLQRSDGRRVLHGPRAPRLLADPERRGAGSPLLLLLPVRRGSRRGCVEPRLRDSRVGKAPLRRCRAQGRPPTSPPERRPSSVRRFITKRAGSESNRSLHIGEQKKYVFSWYSLRPPTSSWLTVIPQTGSLSIGSSPLGKCMGNGKAVARAQGPRSPPPAVLRSRERPYCTRRICPRISPLGWALVCTLT